MKSLSIEQMQLTEGGKPRLWATGTACGLGIAGALIVAGVLTGGIVLAGTAAAMGTGFVAGSAIGGCLGGLFV